MGKAMKSIMQTDRACYLCGRVTGLEIHHVMAGTANKKLSDTYGLCVWLCHNCHTGRDGAQYNPEKNLRLKRDAQVAFQKYYGHKVWMQMFRKNYLNDGGANDE